MILGVEWKNGLEIWRQKIVVFAVFEKYFKAKKCVNILDLLKVLDLKKRVSLGSVFFGMADFTNVFLL